MRIHSLRATTTPSGLSSFAAIYNGNNNNSNQQKYTRTVPSSISRPPRGLCIRCGLRFRPCIDIHEGKVKQIVGSTIQDLKEGSPIPVTNFESDKSAVEYANIYKEDGLTGGHVIMIGADPLSKSAAMEALHAYPGGFQVGGGINPDNALSYIEEGASHVIITSYVFNNGQMELQRLKELAHVVGKRRLVLDLSCRKKEGRYAIVTERWQKFTSVFLDEKIMDFLATYANEFLVHGVDVEGKKLGIDEELVTLLGRHSPIPVTYAGGVTVMADLERIKAAGMGRVDVTVGSALDIFGGNMAYKDVVSWHARQQALALAKPFLEPKTYKKVKFVFGDNQQSRKFMEELFDMDKLESVFGGRNSIGFVYEDYAKRMMMEDKKISDSTDNECKSPSPSSMIQELQHSETNSDKTSEASDDETGSSTFLEEVEEKIEGLSLNCKDAETIEADKKVEVAKLGD